MAVVRVHGLSVHARGAPLLQDVSLVLEQARPTAVVGPSGAGKTTLLRALLGLVSAVAGKIVLDDRELSAVGLAERSTWFGWLPQQVSPSEALPAVDYLIGARFARDEPRARSRRLIREALAACHVAHLADRPVTEISGGELQRVQLAGLLAQDPRFLLLDEPANHLDPALQRELYGLLAGQITAGRGVVAVTHEINLIAELERVTGRPLQVVGMRAGRIAFVVDSDAAGLDRRLGDLYGLPHRALTIDGRRYFIPGLPGASEAGR